MRHGLLDGVIVSCFSPARPLPAGEEPAWEGVAVHPLLHKLIEAQEFGVDQQPAACQEPAALVNRSQDRGLALPVVRELVGRQWLKRNRLEGLGRQPWLMERLWLPLAQGARESSEAQLCWRMLRRKVARSEMMQDRHGIQV